MNKVQIITDSCADLAKDLRDKYGIDYVKMNVVHNEKEQQANLDWENISVKEFYDEIRKGERFLTTQVPVQEFESVFTKYLEMGCDVVYVGCALKLSASVSVGKKVAEQLKEKYPNNEIYCVDSCNSCMGEGLLAIKATEFRDMGLSAKEISEKVYSIRNNVNQFCTVHTLDALRRAGRVKGSSAFFGNLFGVKPIIISDVEGNNAPIKKVKGRQTSLKELVNLTKESIIDAENQIIYIAHADCLDEAVALKEQIMNEIKCKGVYIGYIGPIIGASVGADAIAVFSFGKAVEFGG